jgi:nucleoside 2-deoxyribosyltransferase
MIPKAYLAGPDVFFPNAVLHARNKMEICTRHGLQGLAPLNEDIDKPSEAAGEPGAAEPGAAEQTWQIIYQKDIAMMERCDLIIANLTPFGGASADSGTLIEVGWFLGKGKPIFGYSNSAASFEERMRMQLAGTADGAIDLAIEGFQLPDNLMIVGAVEGSGYRIVVPNDGAKREYNALDVFEACVSKAAKYMATRGKPA